MGKCKRKVRCTLCTPHRWRGNNEGRFKPKEEYRRKESKKELRNEIRTQQNN